MRVGGCLPGGGSGVERLAVRFWYKMLVFRGYLLFFMLRFFLVGCSSCFFVGKGWRGLL